MSDAVFRGELPHYGNMPARFRPPAVANVPNRAPTEANMAKTITMDTFKWIVGGLLVVITALLSTMAAFGSSYIGSLQTDIREVRKDVTEIRVQASATNTKLDDLIGEIRRLPH
jgi:cell division protein FtsL